MQWQARHFYWLTRERREFIATTWQSNRKSGPKLHRLPFLLTKQLGWIYYWQVANQTGNWFRTGLPDFLATMLKGCCHITVDSATTALQDGACTYRCISKQMHYRTPFSHKGYMKNLEIYENYIALSCLERKITFWQDYINSEPCMAYYPKWLKELFSIKNY
jgi:hypothetical protein